MNKLIFLTKKVFYFYVYLIYHNMFSVYESC